MPAFMIAMSSFGNLVATSVLNFSTEVKSVMSSWKSFMTLGLHFVMLSI